MIIAGIIIVGIFLVLSLINMLFMFLGDSNDMRTGFGLHIVFAIGYIGGLVLVAIGIVQALT